MLDVGAAESRRARPTRLATRDTRSRSKPSRSIVSSPMRTFFNDVTSGLQISSSRSVWSSAASIAASKSGPVSMTTALVARCAPPSSTAASSACADDVGLLGSLRRRQHSQPGARVDCSTNARSFSASMSPADAARSAIVARGGHRERERRVAELQVEVDEERLIPERAVATARFVASIVLPLPPLGENTVTTLPVAGRSSAAAPPSGARTAASRSAAAGRGRRRLRSRVRSRRSRSARRRRRGSAERRRARPRAGRRLRYPVPTTTRATCSVTSAVDGDAPPTPSGRMSEIPAPARASPRARWPPARSGGSGAPSDGVRYGASTLSGNVPLICRRLHSAGGRARGSNGASPGSACCCAGSWSAAARGTRSRHLHRPAHRLACRSVITSVAGKSLVACRRPFAFGGVGRLEHEQVLQDDARRRALEAPMW